MKNVLVTYASRSGSTAEIASVFGEIFRSRGCKVDIKPVKTKPSLNGYDTVILGSAVRMGGWLPEMTEFIKVNRPAISSLPVFLYTVHILSTGDDETSRAARSAYLKNIHPLVNPVDEVFFTGKIDLEKLSLLDRMMVKMVKSPIGDYRNWKNICGWAQSIQ